MRKILLAGILSILFAGAAHAQGGPLTPAPFVSGNLAGNGVCIALHMATSNVGYSVSVSGTWTGTVTISQSGDNQANWTTATTTTGNTLYTSALLPGISDARACSTAAQTGTIVVTITASGPATIQNITQTGGGGITSVSSLPGTCTPGAAYTLSVAPFTSYTCPATGVFSDFTGTNAIKLTDFGVKADVRTCIGTALTVTSGSAVVTCTTGNFCNAGAVACSAGQTTDVGKRFNATGACCNNSVPVNTNSQTVPNNTTILSVQSATQITLSATATASTLGVTGGYAFWATDDDAAVTAADTAYQNAPYCTALLWPATPFLVKGPHFNVPNAQCEQLESGGGVGRIATGSYVGWGSNDSVMYLDSVFPNATCNFGNSSIGCFFSYNGVHAMHLGISGGWNQVPNGGGHSYALVNPGQSADFIDIRTVGFSSGDGTTIGLQAASFSNFLDFYLAGFGNTGLLNIGASNVFRGGEFSNVNGACADFEGSADVAPAYTYGLSFGTCSGPTVKVGGGPWHSSGDLVYGNAANNTCIFITGAGARVHIQDGIIGSNGACATNGILMTSSSVVTLHNTTVNATTNEVNMPNAGAKFTDQCGNKFTGAGNFLVGATDIFITCPNPLSTTYVTAPTIGKLNCASSAAPAVCGSYATGSVVVAAAATTVTVNTTAVQANSQILIQEDDTLGTKLGVTCNATLTARTYEVTARTAGTSFQITSSAAPVTNPACLNYIVMN